MQCVDLGGRRIIKKGGGWEGGRGRGWPRLASHLSVLRCATLIFFNDTATTEIYTLHIVGSVRCV